MEVVAIICLSILLGLAFCIAITWIIISSVNRHYQKQLINKNDSVRTFIIDKKEGIVKCFNHNDIRTFKTISIKEFYEQFDEKEVSKLDSWLNSLLRKNAKISECYDINTYIEHLRKRYYSVLRVTSINRLKKIIHLESYLFSSADSSRFYQTFSNKKNNIDEMLKKINFSSYHRGATIVFSFHSINKSNAKATVNYLLYSRLKEIALLYASNRKKRLLEINENEFVIFNFNLINQKETTAYVDEIVRAMNRFLEVSGILNLILTIRVGVVMNSSFPHNPKKLILTAREMADIAFERNCSTITYGVEVTDKDSTKSKRYSEVDEILNKSRAKYTFSCIYEIKSEKVVGYLSHVEVPGASKKMIEDIYNLSFNTEEVQRLVQYTTHQSIDRFYSLNKDTTKRLFKNLKLIDTDNFIIWMEKYKNLLVTPCFEEKDVANYLNGHEDFFDRFDRLKAENISSCLKLSDRTIVLSNKIYSLFDYFIIYLDESKNSDKEIERVGFRAIVEKLLKYDKPIIVTRVHTWSKVELLVRSGIEYISGTALAPTAETLFSPTSKNILKIRKMLE